MITRVESSEDVAHLADRLRDAPRDKPVVVVTTPAGSAVPWVDVEDLDIEIGDLADVVVLRTGALTRELQSLLPARTQVYGGASRVYPTDSGWLSDPYRSPLRFAHSAVDGERVTDQLIADARLMAAPPLRPGPAIGRLVEVDGTVAELASESRALVSVRGRTVTVRRGWAFPTVPMSDVLTPGMRVRGLLDEQRGRLDIRPFASEPAVCLVGYDVGAVVPVRVAEVFAHEARLELHPELVVTVDAGQVTRSPYDDLTSLMSPGEVIGARLLGDERSGWLLSMLDVNDDEPVMTAFSLLPSGPPWLRMAVVEPPSTAAEHVESWTLIAHVGSSAGRKPQAPPASSPALVEDPSLVRRIPAAPSPEPQAAVSATPADVAAAQLSIREAEIAHLHGENACLREEVEAFRDEREMVGGRLDALIRESDRQRREIERLRTQLRSAKQDGDKALRLARRVGSEASEPAFADAEQQFRHEVYLAWVKRIPMGEKATRPLLDFAVGPDFLTSLDEIDGVDRYKVADVVVEVVAGLADRQPGRDMHQLRSGPGGSDPTVVRPSDGATAWRVALQISTPQARRLHFWRTRDGIELSRVAQHDDMTP